MEPTVKKGKGARRWIRHLGSTIALILGILKPCWSFSIQVGKTQRQHSGWVYYHHQLSLSICQEKETGGGKVYYS
jgi:hypothetical protein